MRSSNPVFRGLSSEATYISDRPVTYANVTIKSLFLVAMVFLSAYLTLAYIPVTYPMLIGAMIVGFIAVLIGTRSVSLAPLFAIIYAFAEGMLLGVVSLIFAAAYQGIVQTALLSTLIVFVIMMLLYSTHIIKVTQRFVSVIVVALIAVIFMSFLNIFLQFSSSFFYLVVIASSVLSALFLLIDFRAIESAVETGMDAKYGWILSLGLLVTIVWIYIEMLRLLAIFGRRR